jgi:hypothetical protein
MLLVLLLVLVLLSILSLEVDVNVRRPHRPDGNLGEDQSAFDTPSTNDGSGRRHSRADRDRNEDLEMDKEIFRNLECVSDPRMFKGITDLVPYIWHQLDKKLSCLFNGG